MDFDATAFLAGLFQVARPVCLADLSGDWRDEYEERAAIVEYCGNLPRERAEALALAEIARRMAGKKNLERC